MNVADSFLFLLFLIVVLCRDDCAPVGWFQDYRSTTSLWFRFFHLLCACVVLSLCVWWWMRVTCASHREEGVLLISFCLFVWLPLSISCGNARNTRRLDTRNQRRCSREKERATKRRWNKEEESWEESHMACPK